MGCTRPLGSVAVGVPRQPIDVHVRSGQTVSGMSGASYCGSSPAQFCQSSRVSVAFGVALSCLSISKPAKADNRSATNEPGVGREVTSPHHETSSWIPMLAAAGLVLSAVIVLFVFDPSKWFSKS